MRDDSWGNRDAVEGWWVYVDLGVEMTMIQACIDILESDLGRAVL
jgi:hypothetical protein